MAAAGAAHPASLGTLQHQGPLASSWNLAGCCCCCCSRVGAFQRTRTRASHSVRTRRGPALVLGLLARQRRRERAPPRIIGVGKAGPNTGNGAGRERARESRSGRGGGESRLNNHPSRARYRTTRAEAGLAGARLRPATPPPPLLLLLLPPAGDCACLRGAAALSLVLCQRRLNRRGLAQRRLTPAPLPPRAVATSGPASFFPSQLPGRHLTFNPSRPIGGRARARDSTASKPRESRAAGHAPRLKADQRPGREEGPAAAAERRMKEAAMGRGDVAATGLSVLRGKGDHALASCQLLYIKSSWAHLPFQIQNVGFFCT